MWISSRPSFSSLAFSFLFVASAGSLISGYISDIIFQGRRAPVAAGLYFLETCIILLAAQFQSVNATVFLVLISFTANATHFDSRDGSVDGHWRSEDGWLRVAGVIDSFQYFGAALPGWCRGAPRSQLGELFLLHGSVPE